MQRVPVPTAGVHPVLPRAGAPATPGAAPGGGGLQAADSGGTVPPARRLAVQRLAAPKPSSANGATRERPQGVAARPQAVPGTPTGHAGRAPVQQHAGPTVAGGNVPASVQRSALPAAAVLPVQRFPATPPLPPVSRTTPAPAPPRASRTVQRAPEPTTHRAHETQKMQKTPRTHKEHTAQKRVTAPPASTSTPIAGGVFDPRSLTEFQLDELTHRLIGRITRQLRTELRLDRERVGRLRDPRQ
ncbi:hypothetical protein [Streptomyces sp. R33]|uniref:Extensin n=1 Tax=Streptomyces sp. R33 TaxID=3238629 RepID=A0AB39XVE9_9ACTN